MDRPLNLLIVCSGNTCRSPMAVGLARRILGSSAVIESAGTDTADGLPATRHAVSVMRERGIDISAHRSRDLDGIDLARFDLFVAMIPDIATRLKERGAGHAKIVTLEVPDPYYKGIDVYRETADVIAKNLRRIFAARGWRLQHED